jgi:hypothetical protein
MTNEQDYQANQDYIKFQTLINTTEILNQEEYEFCKSWDAAETTLHLFNVSENRWLNLNVYSEHEHHESVQRMENGY